MQCDVAKSVSKDFEAYTFVLFLARRPDFQLLKAIVNFRFQRLCRHQAKLRPRSFVSDSTFDNYFR